MTTTVPAGDSRLPQDPPLELALVCLDAVRRGTAARGATFTLVVVGGSGKQVLGASTGPDESVRARDAARAALDMHATIELTSAAAAAPLPDLAPWGDRVRGAVAVVSTDGHATTALLDVDQALRQYGRNLLR